MNTQRFDFGQWVDGLTIEIRINENHRQALRLQMIERFDTRQGQRRLHPTVKMAAVMAIGFGLVGIGLVVHQSTTPPPAPGVDVNNALDRMDLAAGRGDLSVVTEFLRVRSLPVQRAAIRHLAILGNMKTVEELEAFLQVDREPDIQSAAEQAIMRIRQRLSIPLSPPPVDSSQEKSPPEMQKDAPVESLPQSRASKEKADFRLVVVDDESSQPLDQVHVQFGWPRHKAAGVTDPHGICIAAWGETSPPYFRVQIWKTGYAGRSVEWRPDASGRRIPAAYTLRLRRGVTLSGRVLDENNQPVAGVEVRASIGIHEALREQIYLPHSRCVTDIEGRWVLHDYSGRSAASQYASLAIDHPDYILDRWQGILDHFADLQAGTHVLKVSRGIELSGQVLDHAGDPILGATVAEGYDLRMENGTAWQTDVQGHFALRRLQAGRKILTVSAPGYAPEMTVIDLESDLHEATFSLQPGNSLRFEVVDSEGHPLRGVSVETRAWRTFSPLRRAFNLKRQTKTNAKGAATLTDLPADDVIFKLTKKGYAECHHLQACPADRKIVVVLHRSGAVFGRILDRETGVLIPHAQIIKGPHWPDREGPVWQAHQPRELADGHYRHVFEVHDEGMALRAEAPGYLPEETDVFYNDSSRVERDILLTPAHTLSGVVLGPGARPAPSVLLRVAHAQKPAVLVGGHLRVEPGVRSLSSNGQGQFSLPPQRQTYWLIAVGDRGMAEISEESFLATGTLQLQPWGRIEGRLLQGHRPAADTPVSCHLTHRASRHPPIVGSYETLTDAHGCFVLERVRPGTVRLMDQTLEVLSGETTLFTGSGPVD